MTNTILRIDASARHEGSVSRALGDQLVAAFGPANIITRDLALGIDHMDEAWVGSTFVPADDRNDAQKQALALSDELLAEIDQADRIVITSALYNFNIPSTLKAWIDQITRAGVAFRYTDNGPEGLLKSVPVTIVISAGGTVQGADNDFVTAYLKYALAFVGLTDVEVIMTQLSNPASQDVAKERFHQIAA